MKNISKLVDLTFVLEVHYVAILDSADHQIKLTNEDGLFYNNGLAMLRDQSDNCEETKIRAHNSSLV